MTLVFACFLFIAMKLGAVQSQNCPKVCPDSTWKQYPTTLSDHCYFLPRTNIPFLDFWNFQNYCKSIYPTSYIVVLNSDPEKFTAGGVVSTYFGTYLSQMMDVFAWVGAYYMNGAWHFLDGQPVPSSFTSTLMPPLNNLLGRPDNGSCAYYDPRTTLITLSWRPCSDNKGATACEMEPIEDCNATPPPTTTRPVYQAADCEEEAYGDFVRQQNNGYLAIQELTVLSNMDPESCAIACLYYSLCYSFDLQLSTGDCRLLESSNMFTCGSQFSQDDDWTHYDLATMREQPF